MLSLILFSLTLAYAMFIHSKVQKLSDENVSLKSQAGSMRHDFTREINSIADSLQSVKDKQKAQAENIELLFEKFKNKAIVKNDSKKG